MSKKVAKLFIIFLMILLDFLIVKFVDRNELGSMEIQLQLLSNCEQEIQLYYKQNNTDGWQEDDSVKQNYNEVNSEQLLEFSIPGSMKNIRLDLGNVASNIEISAIQIIYKKNTFECDLQKVFSDVEEHLIVNSRFEKGIFYIETTGDDPYVTLNVPEDIYRSIYQIQQKYNLLKNICLALCVSLLFIWILVIFDRIIESIYNVVSNYKLIFNLAKNDFKTKYAGSYFGIVWAFIQPIVTILVYWFVFGVAFNSGPVDGCPYVLWLVSGLIPWFFFQESLQSATNSLIEYSYLVKKVVFNISIIPIVKIISALFVHLFFVIILLVIFVISGVGINVHAVQLLYYSICMLALTTALSYFTSALVVFFRDLGQIVGIVLQIGIWITPIMWNYTIVGMPGLQMLLQLNPMFYIVNGYRSSLVTNGWIWDNPNWTIYFWLLVSGLMLIGGSFFNKLKVHFADVL